MADPAEIAQRVLRAQAKTFEKAASFIIKVGKGFLKNLSILRDAFKYLVSKLRMIQAFIPASIVKAIKGAFKFLKSVILTIRTSLKEIIKCVVSIGRVVKNQLTKKLLAALTFITNTVKRMIQIFVIAIKSLIVLLKRILKMVPLLSEVASAIRMIVSNIFDIISKLYSAMPLQVIAKIVEARLLKMQKILTGLQRHLAKDVKKVIKNMA